MKPKPDDSALSKLRLFAELDEAEIGALVDHSAVESYSDGHKILADGDEGYCMYVLLKGGASVKVGGREIAALGEGDFFGEIALVDDGPRSADVFASGPTEVLVITRMTLGLLAAVQPGAAIHLLAAIGKSLVAKLRADNRRFRELVCLSTPGSVPEN